MELIGLPPALSLVSWPHQGAPPRVGAAEVGRADGRVAAGPRAMKPPPAESRFATGGPDTLPTTQPLDSRLEA